MRFRRTAYRLVKTLRLCLSPEEVQDLRGVLNQNAAIIHGITALEYFRRELIDTSHPVELAVDTSGAVGLCRWIVLIGFTLHKQSQSPEQGRHKEVLVDVAHTSTDALFAKLQEMEDDADEAWRQNSHVGQEIGAVWVGEFNRPDSQSIVVTITLYNSVHTVLSAHASEFYSFSSDTARLTTNSAHLINVIDGEKAHCMFPKLTLHLEHSVRLLAKGAASVRRERDRITGSRYTVVALEDVVLDGRGRTAREQTIGELMQPVRNIGDRYTLSIPLDFGVLNPSSDDRPAVAVSTAGNSFRIATWRARAGGEWKSGLYYHPFANLHRSRLTAGEDIEDATRALFPHLYVRPRDLTPEPGEWNTALDQAEREIFDYVLD